MKTTTVMPLKVWMDEEARRLGIKPHALRMRLTRHNAWPKLRRTNSRVIDVVVTAGSDF